MGNKAKTCCICGKKFWGWGNNPYPIKDDGECCDECNKQVIAARLLRIIRKEKETKVII